MVSVDDDNCLIIYASVNIVAGQCALLIHVGPYFKDRHLSLIVIILWMCVILL